MYIDNDYYDDDKEFLIAFYKERYLYFLKIGIGGYTNFNTQVTSTLIKATANRLDQLIKGEVTDENRCYGISKVYTERPKYDSNRSFGWDYSSLFRYSDLAIEQKHSVEYPITIIPTYIDKYTTAYRTIKEYK